MLNHQLDLTQSELGALKEVHLAATASEPADKARDVKLEHEQRDGSEPSESSDIGSNDSELEDPHGSDPVWDLEGVWRCGDPECGWEVADGRCVGCDWEYYKGHGEERWDYFVRPFGVVLRVADPTRASSGASVRSEWLRVEARLAKILLTIPHRAEPTRLRRAAPNATHSEHLPTGSRRRRRGRTLLSTPRSSPTPPASPRSTSSSPVARVLA